MIRIGIIGGGHGGEAVLKSIHNLPDVKVTGIADLRDDAPGIIYARKLGIACYRDFTRLLETCPDMVIEATGKKQVQDEIYDKKDKNTRVIESDMAQLIIDMFHSKEEMIEDLHQQAQQLAAMAQQMSASVQQFGSTAGDLAVESESLASQVKQIYNHTGIAKQNLSETAEILRFIKGVATKTKLLGLNAAIEAARVGEQGRGFAVVADEVRKLAEESAASAVQIGNIINNIGNSVNQMISGVEDITKISQHQAEATTSMAATAGQLESLSEELSRVAQKLASID